MSDGGASDGMEAQDSFSIRSGDYARDRPTYPPELFAWIASQCRDHRAAWDCATGNGQAALALAEHFERVEATDLSPRQIERGFPARNIAYSAQPAERTDFGDAHFDLIAVAQALHWFDFGLFWPEARRVAKPGALFCAWGYSWFEGETALHLTFTDPLLALLEPYWAVNNRILWNGYRSEEIGFPFERIDAPAFSIQVEWGITSILGFVRTWSAYKRARLEPATAKLLDQLEAEARSRFEHRGSMPLTMPLAVAAGPIS